jgi:hypothetical protein
MDKIMLLDLPIISFNLSFSFVAFSLLAAWYLWPWLVKQSTEKALQILLWPHVFRHIGLMFLAPGAVKSTLPEAFSIPAAYGDLTAAGLALLALLIIRAKPALATIPLWIFSIVGTVDLLYAVIIGTLNNADNAMGATYWIPAVIAPALLVSHIMIFKILFKRTA